MQHYQRTLGGRLYTLHDSDEISTIVPKARKSVSNLYCIHHSFSVEISSELHPILQHSIGKANGKKQPKYRWGKLHHSIIWYDICMVGVCTDPPDRGVGAWQGVRSPDRGVFLFSKGLCVFCDKIAGWSKHNSTTIKKLASFFFICLATIRYENLPDSMFQSSTITRKIVSSKCVA